MQIRKKAVRILPNFSVFSILGFLLLLGGNLFANPNNSQNSLGSSTAKLGSVKTSHAIAELVQETNTVTPGSSPWIGLRLELEKDWHTYWKNPGDSGLPTKVEWTLPDGWKISEPKWELPTRIPMPPLTNLGFSNETLLAYELNVPREVAPGDYLLSGKASWLICKEECIPEKADLILKVVVSAGDAKPSSAHRMFQNIRKQQPVALPQGSFLSVRISGKELSLEFDNDPSWLEGKVDFFPFENQIISIKEGPRLDGKSRLVFERAEPFSSTAKKLSGVLIVGKNVYSVDVDLPPRDATVSSSSNGTNTQSAVDASSSGNTGDAAVGSLLAVVFALLGGVLLNLMPCVFPVLGIKVMSFAHQNESKSGKIHGYLYTLGVLVSFWILAIVLLVLRSAGENVGWGFQLQEPIFVAGLIFLFAVLTANLAGFFEIGGRWMGLGAHLTEKEGNWGAFFTGVLAVVVATPCTAPFMGVAIGTVISKPWPIVLAVFSALGFGLALPFLFLSWNPSLVKKLPKPGMWMLRLKEFFAFPMAATVIWLLWVFGQQVGVNGLALAAIGVLVLFAAIWIFHRFSGFWKWIGWILVGISIFMGWKSTSFTLPSMIQSSSSTWKKFSPADVEAALADGKAVFVDFTAAWCLTCQANKAIVLDTSEMQEFFQKEGVVLFLADWTNSDPVITKELERFGRIGVPLYLAYAKGSKEAKILPQVLTKEIVKNAIVSR